MPPPAPDNSISASADAQLRLEGISRQDYLQVRNNRQVWQAFSRLVAVYRADYEHVARGRHFVNHPLQQLMGQHMREQVARLMDERGAQQWAEMEREAMVWELSIVDIIRNNIPGLTAARLNAMKRVLGVDARNRAESQANTPGIESMNLSSLSPPDVTTPATPRRALQHSLA